MAHQVYAGVERAKHALVDEEPRKRRAHAAYGLRQRRAKDRRDRNRGSVSRATPQSLPSASEAPHLDRGDPETLAGVSRLRGPQRARARLIPRRRDGRRAPTSAPGTRRARSRFRAPSAHGATTPDEDEIRGIGGGGEQLDGAARLLLPFRCRSRAPPPTRLRQFAATGLVTGAAVRSFPRPRRRARRGRR